MAIFLRIQIHFVGGLLFFFSSVSYLFEQKYNFFSLRKIIRYSKKIRIEQTTRKTFSRIFGSFRKFLLETEGIVSEILLRLPSAEWKYFFLASQQTVFPSYLPLFLGKLLTITMSVLGSMSVYRVAMLSAFSLPFPLFSKRGKTYFTYSRKFYTRPGVLLFFPLANVIRNFVCNLENREQRLSRQYFRYKMTTMRCCN